MQGVRLSGSAACCLPQCSSLDAVAARQSVVVAPLLRRASTNLALHSSSPRTTIQSKGNVRVAAAVASSVLEPQTTASDDNNDEVCITQFSLCLVVSVWSFYT